MTSDVVSHTVLYLFYQYTVTSLLGVTKGAKKRKKAIKILFFSVILCKCFALRQCHGQVKY